MTNHPPPPDTFSIKGDVILPGLFNLLTPLRYSSRLKQVICPVVLISTKFKILKSVI